MWIRVLLFLMGLGWGGYGLYCLLFPGALAEIAGLNASTAWGTTELRAMYGGLQISVGVSALLACFRVVAIDKALFVQIVALAGLGTARLIGAVMTSDWSTYTVGGLCFEWLVLALSIVAMRSQAAR